MESKFSSEKLQLIQLLLKIENPSVIKRVKDLLTEESPKIFSKQDVVNRANDSEVAYQKGNTLSLDELEKEVSNW